VSHLKQRTEKSCLNCNANVNGRFCSICGQENLEPQESVWHLLVHFFNDITHFDGKFFSSVKYVVTKPGFLTSEYVAGRRMAYLNPVRFYVFTSFIFFLILFTFFLDKTESKNDVIKFTTTTTPQDSLKYIKKLKAAGVDSIVINNISSTYGLDSLRRYINDNKLQPPSITIGDIIIKSEEEYDSLKNIGKIKQNSFEQYFTKKQLLIIKKYGNDSKKRNADWLDAAIHSIPQMLFFALPFFAFSLYLLYVRRREFYYVAHVIFTIHIFIFFYIDFLVIKILLALEYASNFTLLKYLTIIMVMAIPFYIFKAMRNFYGQSRFKTCLKMFILFFALCIIFIFFVTILAAFSYYKL
jgi:hypothetical protein